MSEFFHAFVRFAPSAGDPGADAETIRREEAAFREAMGRNGVDVRRFAVVDRMGEAEVLARGEDPEGALWSGFIRFSREADRQARSVRWEYEWQAISLGPKL